VGSRSDQILVFHRKDLPRAARFVPAGDLDRLLDAASQTARWMTRSTAERSRSWVQPIPCALIRMDDRYLALRRTRATRSDLRSRVTVLTGGHVDYSHEGGDIRGWLLDTLRRELHEELGIRKAFDVVPVGVVIDKSSIKSSRHIAFVFEARIEEPVAAQAAEEFVLDSSFSGVFLNRGHLLNFESRFDPWSKIICDAYISPHVLGRLGSGHRERQLTLPIVG